MAIVDNESRHRLPDEFLFGTATGQTTSKANVVKSMSLVVVVLRGRSPQQVIKDLNK